MALFGLSPKFQILVSPRSRGQTSASEPGICCCGRVEIAPGRDADGARITGIDPNSFKVVVLDNIHDYSRTLSATYDSNIIGNMVY